MFVSMLVLCIVLNHLIDDFMLLIADFMFMTIAITIFYLRHIQFSLCHFTESMHAISAFHTFGHGKTRTGIPVLVYTIHPIAAIMKPIPAYNLILIFWYPLWYFVYKMMADSTS